MSESPVRFETSTFVTSPDSIAAPNASSTRAYFQERGTEYDMRVAVDLHPSALTSWYTNFGGDPGDPWIYVGCRRSGFEGEDVLPA